MSKVMLFICIIVTPSHSSAGSASGSVDTPPSSKARRLADLFRPPFDIMYRGSFEEVKSTCRQSMYGQRVSSSTL